MNRIKKTYILFTVVLTLLLVGAGLYFFLFNNNCDPSLQCYSNSRGASSTDSVGKAFVDGLNKKDANKISNLIPEDHDYSQEVALKIKNYGGKDIKDLKLDFEVNTESSFSGRLNLTGKMNDGTPYSDKLNLQKSGNNRWYLIMGCVPPANGGTGSCVHPNY